MMRPAPVPRASTAPCRAGASTASRRRGVSTASGRTGASTASGRTGGRGIGRRQPGQAAVVRPRYPGRPKQRPPLPPRRRPLPRRRRPRIRLGVKQTPYGNPSPDVSHIPGAYAGTTTGPLNPALLPRVSGCGPTFATVGLSTGTSGACARGGGEPGRGEPGRLQPSPQKRLKRDQVAHGPRRHRRLDSARVRVPPGRKPRVRQQQRRHAHRDAALWPCGPPGHNVMALWPPGPSLLNPWPPGPITGAWLVALWPPRPITGGGPAIGGATPRVTEA